METITIIEEQAEHEDDIKVSIKEEKTVVSTSETMTTVGEIKRRLEQLEVYLVEKDKLEQQLRDVYESTGYKNSTARKEASFFGEGGGEKKVTADQLSTRQQIPTSIGSVPVNTSNTNSSTNNS